MRHLPADGGTDQMPLDADASRFHPTGRDGKAQHMQRCGIQIDRHPRSAAAGRLRRAFAHKPFLEQRFHHGAHAIGRHSRALMQLKTAERPFQKELANHFTLAEIRDHRRGL